MKDFLTSPYLLYPLIIAGMVAEFKYNLEWTGNLAMFATWFLIVISFLGLFLDSEKLFERKTNVVKMTLLGSCLVVQIIVGWMVTATFFAAAWLLLVAKKMTHDEKLKG